MKPSSDQSNEPGGQPSFEEVHYPLAPAELRHLLTTNRDLIRTFLESGLGAPRKQGERASKVRKPVPQKKAA